jgi:hypothetical protein
VTETSDHVTHPVVLVVETIEETFEALYVVHSGQISVNQY